MQHFKNILCVIDPDRSNNALIERAVTLAETNHASLTLACHLQLDRAALSFFTQEQGEEFKHRLEQEETARMSALADPYRQRVDIETTLLGGVPFLSIIYDVLRHGRDLVMKVPATPDWVETLFGSDDMHLLRKCPCPVWMLTPDTPPAFKRILVCIDVDPEENTAASEADQKAINSRLLQIATSVTHSEKAQLHIAHVWDAAFESLKYSALLKISEDEIDTYVQNTMQGQQEKLERLLSEFSSEGNGGLIDRLHPRIHLVRGVPSKVIPDLARTMKIDLIVMGTVGRTGIPGFIMGNTAETILSDIHCSVLAIKPPSFKSPVTLEA